MTQQPNLGMGHLIVEVSRSHTYMVVGRLWTSDHQFSAEAATYTTHNKHKRWTSMLSVGFKPTIPAIELPQTYALDRTATGISLLWIGVVVPLQQNGAFLWN